MKFITVLSLFLVAVCDDLGFASHQPNFSTLEGISKRIAGGELAKPKQFPYQVRLVVTEESNGILGKTLCGGALISKNFVLTAAHCLDNAVSVTIFMGTNKVKGYDRNRITRGVSQYDIIIHEKWNSTTVENDIALINIPIKFKLSDAVQPISLPRASLVNLDNRKAFISGFGRMGTNKPASEDLLFAVRTIISSENCKRDFPLYYKNDMHLCVDGSNNISTCSGDSGGPLAIEDTDGSKVVVGLTSFGGLTCDTGLPVVFTRITKYLQWIHKHTGITISN